MSYWPFLISLFVVDFLAAMSPGPNFVLVTQAALHGGRRYARGVVAGITAANLIWCLAIILGLAALFRVQPWLHDVLRVGGGAYLFFLGAQMLRGGKDVRQAGPISRAFGVREAIVRGAVTNLANPKSAVYFGSVFAVFLAPGVPAWVQFCAVAIVIIDTIVWYGSVATLLTSRRAQGVVQRGKRLVERTAGVLMIAFGLRLLATRRPLAY